MSKTIHFENATQNQSIASTYTLYHQNEQGQLQPVHVFDGEETVRTICPDCGQPHDMDFLEFCNFASNDFEFYGTQIFCGKCSAKRKR